MIKLYISAAVVDEQKKKSCKEISTLFSSLFTAASSFSYSFFIVLNFSHAPLVDTWSNLFQNEQLLVAENVF